MRLLVCAVQLVEWVASVGQSGIAVPQMQVITAWQKGAWVEKMVGGRETEIPLAPSAKLVKSSGRVWIYSKRQKRRSYKHDSCKIQLKKVSVREKQGPIAPKWKKCWESCVVTQTAGLVSWASHRHGCDTEGTEPRPDQFLQVRLDPMVLPGSLFPPLSPVGWSHQQLHWHIHHSLVNPKGGTFPWLKDHDENIIVYKNDFQICTQSILWTSDKKIMPQTKSFFKLFSKNISPEAYYFEPACFFYIVMIGSWEEHRGAGAALPD